MPHNESRTFQSAKNVSYVISGVDTTFEATNIPSIGHELSASKFSKNDLSWPTFKGFLKITKRSFSLTNVNAVPSRLNLNPQ
jgi:hypothetical protein